MPDKITEMAAKGKAKYASKKDLMVERYQAALARAVEAFKAVGFGPMMNKSYEVGCPLARTDTPPSD